MKPFNLKKRSIAIASASLMSIGLSSAWAQSLTDLGTLGGSSSTANLISADGRVIVGYSYITGDTEEHAYKYANSTMTDLGSIGGGGSYPNAVSADGQVIVGGAAIAGNTATHAFKYSNGTMTDLGTLGGGTSNAYAVSADGQVIAGIAYLSGDVAVHAIKYAGNTMTDLGTLGGRDSYAHAISADGQVIVGYSYIPGNAGYHAFKYIGNTMTDLGTLGGSYSSAKAVSADGRVIVGDSNIAGDAAYHAFKYIGNTMTGLGTLGGSVSSASAVSADGQVIVGYSYITGDTAWHAFKYIGNTMTDLGTLGGSFSGATAISADGRVIVGGTTIAGNAAYHAFKYINGVMTDLGTLGGSSSGASAVSADGRVIVGNSDIAGDTANHPFVYYVPTSSLIDVPNTYSALATNGYQLNSILNLQNTLLTTGLNHDCTVFGENDLCVAAGGSYTSTNNTNTSKTSANLRIAYRFTPEIYAGFFVDQSISNSMPSNYSLTNSQPMSGLFATWSPSQTALGPSVKVSAAYSNQSANITRTVLTYTEAGSGSTTFVGQGAQVEGAYGLEVNGDTTAQPFVGVRATKVGRNSYSETNAIGFPITYNAINQNTTTAYAGARVISQVLPDTVLKVSIGAEQDISNSISDYSGTISTLGAFNMSVPSTQKTRGFTSLGVDYWLTKNQRLSASAAYKQQPLNNANAYSGMVSYTVGL